MAARGLFADAAIEEAVRSNQEKAQKQNLANQRTGPIEDAAGQIVDLAEACDTELGGCFGRTGSAAAVHVGGTVRIERGNAPGEIEAGDVNVERAGQMAGAKLIGAAHIYEHGTGLAHTNCELVGGEVPVGSSSR